jgi:hypothetical protein
MKFQNPNYNFQIRSKFQNTNSKLFGACDLVLGICLEIGAWKLEF